MDYLDQLEQAVRAADAAYAMKLATCAQFMKSMIEIDVTWYEEKIIEIANRLSH